MPALKIHKKVKGANGQEILLTEGVYRHIQRTHPEVIPWLDTALKTVISPDVVFDDGDDKVYLKKLPEEVKSFVQDEVEYCLVPVTKRSEGYLAIKTCYFITEETFQRKTWKP